MPKIVGPKTGRDHENHRVGPVGHRPTQTSGAGQASGAEVAEGGGWRAGPPLHQPKIAHNPKKVKLLPSPIPPPVSPIPPPESRLPHPPSKAEPSEASEPAVAAHPLVVVDLADVAGAVVVEEADDHVGGLEAVFELAEALER